MRREVYSMALWCLIFIFVGATAAGAQHEQHNQQKPPAQTAGQGNMQHDSSGMGSLFDEPHEALMMAHLRNVATFAKALSTQVEARKAVDPAFAQAAVAEIRRNFDTMQQHLAFYQRSMPADMASHAGMQSQAGTHSHAGMQSNAQTQSHSGVHSSAGRSQVSDEHITEVRRALELLEREVDSDAPRAGKVSERAAAIVSHTEMMTSHGGHKM